MEKCSGQCHQAGHAYEQVSVSSKPLSLRNVLIYQRSLQWNPLEDAPLEEALHRAVRGPAGRCSWQIQQAPHAQGALSTRLAPGLPTGVALLVREQLVGFGCLKLFSRRDALFQRHYQRGISSISAAAVSEAHSRPARPQAWHPR